MMEEGTPPEHTPLPGRTTRTAGVPLSDGVALVRWSTWDPPWQSEGENASYAVPTPNGPVLVDPEAPAPGEDARVWTLLERPPAAILLTTADHERDAYRLGAAGGAGMG